MIWRYQDDRNYYALDFSVDQKAITLVHVENGQPHSIPIPHEKSVSPGLTHDLRAGQWYVVKIDTRGPHIRVLFGNRLLFDATDDSLLNAGKTGVFARSGTVVSFDDFRLDRKG